MTSLNSHTKGGAIMIPLLPRWKAELGGIRSPKSDGRAGIQSTVFPEVTPEPIYAIASRQCLGTSI